MKRLALASRRALLCSTIAVTQAAAPTTPLPTDTTSMTSQTVHRIRITDGTSVLTATPERSPSAADFLSMLPLTLTLEDYAATEKIAYLPRKLTTAGAPPGIDPAVADIAYYAPWGNLAIFYRDAGYANGLVRLGRLDSGLSSLQRNGPLKVRIERIDD